MDPCRGMQCVLRCRLDPPSGPLMRGLSPAVICAPFAHNSQHRAYTDRAQHITERAQGTHGITRSTPSQNRTTTG